MDNEQLDKVASVIYYLYHTKKMNPNAMAGSWHIEETFKNACELLLNMTPEQFESVETRVREGMMK